MDYARQTLESKRKAWQDKHEWFEVLMRTENPKSANYERNLMNELLNMMELKSEIIALERLVGE